MNGGTCADRPGEFRTLALFCGAFAAGIFLAQYLLPADRLPAYAAAAFVLSLARFLVPGVWGKRFLLAGTALSLSLGWNWLYIRQVSAPAAALSGTEQTVELTLCEYPSPAARGVKAAARIPGVPGQVMWYADLSCAGLEPGQTVRNTVRFQDAGRIREDDVTAFTSRGIYLLAYGQEQAEPADTGSPEAEANPQGAASVRDTIRKRASALRWVPARFGNAVREGILSFRKESAAGGFLTDDEAAFLAALLTGDRSGLSEQAAADLEEAGLAHVLAVSGMHCGFLLALLAFLVGRHRRRLLALCAAPVLIFFALLTGGRPSVVRACIMLLFLCAAPLFRRESDAPTALAAALFLILFHNPHAAASVSLQLSFASVAGLLLLTPRAYRFLTEPLKEYALFQGKTALSRVLRGAAYFAAANLSASLGALAFTAPLSGYYFGVLPLIAPLSGILCLWAVGAAFVTGLLSVLLGAAVPFLGPAAAMVPGLLIRYTLAVAHAAARVPGHAVTFANPLLKYWLAFAYLLCAIAYYMERRSRREATSNTAETAETEKRFPWRTCLTAVLLALSLFCTVFLYRAQYRHTMDAVVLDAGQGQCILLASGGRYALADCGSSNSWYSPGADAARKLRAMGGSRLDALLLTHFDADHVNGTEALLARIPVRELLIPDVEGNETADSTADGTAGGTVDKTTGETAAEANAAASEDAKPGDSSRARDAILSLASQYGIRVRTVTEREALPFGNGTLTVFPPLGASGDNDRGLSLLASAGETDFLITGDMGQAAEKKLLAAFDLPDLEAFAAGHHGSKYSTSEALLDALTPETVCVSVGSNSYGHPAPETLDRLAEHGCAVFRTDRDGDIHLIFD